MSKKRELTRAETVRMRRRLQNAKWPRQSSERSARPLPPITSRGGMAYLAPKHAPSTKRRYQATLHMPGVQVQMPTITLPDMRLGWRLLSFFLSILLSTALYLLWTLPMFRVASVQVVGNQRVSAEEINAVLNSAGQPIFKLVPSQLETRLRLNYAELASVKVTLGLPNLLSVNVTERQPIILWQQGGGYTWIDENGVAFRPRGIADGLILVSALAAPAPGLPSENDPLSPLPYISTEMVRALQALAPNVPPGLPITYDPRYGLGWADSRGWQVFFGQDSKDAALKVRVYQSLVDSLTQRGIVPALISVQYPNAPFYRMGQ